MKRSPRHNSLEETQTTALDPSSSALVASVLLNQANGADQNVLENIEKIEAGLWDAAEKLRAKSKLTLSEYCTPVLGVIFLRYVTSRYEAAKLQIAEEQANGSMPKRPLVKPDFRKRRALMLPKEARYDELLELSKEANLGAALNEAMNAIEQDFDPLFHQLPKCYDKFDEGLLEDLLRIFDIAAFRTVNNGIFGHIYEYFLMKFATQAKDSAQSVTPASIVQMIVNVIEPDHGIVFDPACGSGEMLVQSARFIEQRSDDNHPARFFGQERVGARVCLANMNLAVNNLEGGIREANSLNEDTHDLGGQCDFVIANPPSEGGSDVGPNEQDDRSSTFGHSGVAKIEKASSDYLWISSIENYLGPKGRAGFVVSSQASSAGRGAAEFRSKLVQMGDVDVIISIQPNCFYTRTLPCELWYLDKGKPADRRGQVLMLDARSIYRKVTRKIFDFSPEQLQNLTAIIWLYRGESDRFLSLVQSYLDKTIAEAAAIAERSAAFREAFQSLQRSDARRGPKDASIRDIIAERDSAAEVFFASLDQWNARIVKDWNEPCELNLTSQKERIAELCVLADACRSFIKEGEFIRKLAVRVVESADFQARDKQGRDDQNTERLTRDLDIVSQSLVEKLGHTAYFERQAHWLLARFPDAKFTPVAGLCRSVTREEIEATNGSLTPGRYVGAVPPEMDEDFEQILRDIHVELDDLNREAIELAEQIQETLRTLKI